MTRPLVWRAAAVVLARTGGGGVGPEGGGVGPEGGGVGRESVVCPLRLPCGVVAGGMVAAAQEWGVAACEVWCGVVWCGVVLRRTPGDREGLQMLTRRAALV